MGDFCAKLMIIRPADEIIEVEGIVNLTGLGNNEIETKNTYTATSYKKINTCKGIFVILMCIILVPPSKGDYIDAI